jgi:hypothetical protein
MAFISKLTVDVNAPSDDPGKETLSEVEDHRPRPTPLDVVYAQKLNMELTKEGSVVRAFGEAIFILLGRIETLEGGSQTTKQQFIGWIKSKMKS